MRGELNCLIFVNCNESKRLNALSNLNQVAGCADEWVLLRLKIFILGIATNQDWSKDCRGAQAS